MSAFLDKKERYDVGDLVILNTITGIVVKADERFAHVHMINGYVRKFFHKDLHFMNKV
jgi:hypothetical protein